MFCIGQELTIITVTQRTVLPRIIIDMHYFETIMTMEIRHRQSLVESHTFWAAIGAFLEINADLIDLDQRLVCRKIMNVLFQYKADIRVDCSERLLSSESGRF